MIHHSNTPISLKQQDSMDLVNDPSRQEGNRYEVFLSFSRGKDAQVSFPFNLYSSSRKVGISVLKDDVSSTLLRSIIEGCEISIVIFSKHYASSRKCLEELTKIMKFHKAYEQVVLPIFYGVDRFDVCNLKYGFGEAFQGLIERISPTEHEVSRWRIAISEAASNYGFFVPYFNPNNENEYIQNIVKSVRYILLKMKGPFATEGLVGLDAQVKEVITMLQNHKSRDVVSIGIWGMGGIGKTTLATVIFDYIRYEFESVCFLSNIREAWERASTDPFVREILSDLREGKDVLMVGADQSACLKMSVIPCDKKYLLCLMM